MSTPTTVVGIDLGGTTIKAGLVSSDGRILYQTKLPSRAAEGPSAVIQQIAAAVRNVADNGGTPTIRSVGIGSPGVVDDNGVVKAPPNLMGWDEIPLAAELSHHFPGYRIVVENDANVAAIAESRFGAGKVHPNFLFIIWGTGVGGGIILDGKIFRGPTGGAGEVGHISIDYNGPDCNCGNRGCVEAYIGQRYLSQRTAERLRAHPESSLLGLVGGDFAKIEPMYIAQAAAGGDRFCREMLVEAGMLLGVAIAAVMDTIDLRVSIVGGGISGAGDLVLRAAEESARSRVLKPLRPDIRVIQAELGNSAGLLGAAGLVL